MRNWADFDTRRDSSGGLVLVFTGALVVEAIAKLDRNLGDLGEPVAALDLTTVSEIDTVGAWVVWRTMRDHEAALIGASDKAERLIAAVRGSDDDTPMTPERAPLVPRVLGGIGAMVGNLGSGSLGVLGFLGAVVAAIGQTLRHPSRLRRTALVRQFELVGVSALPIIGLMSFLIGIVIAQQGAAQLEQFGAQIYTVNLTGRLSLRELGVLMTAIMVAGRSGSSFAAQLGTMKLTEEVDAMRTIGVSPVEALVLPRILAAVLMMPLLGFFASLLAVMGGAFISRFSLGIPFLSFLLRIQEVVPITDVWVGLIKAPVFGLIIGIAGCYQGMQVEGNSEQVGLRTTQAVVLAIFMVIVLDAFFAVFFSSVGWG